MKASSVFDEPEAGPPPQMDPAESWQKFVTKFKAVLRNPKVAQEKWKEDYDSGQLRLAFMNSEMQYVGFGEGSPVKGIDPKRVYEVGIVTLAAKETKGAEGEQVREYVLHFISPYKDENWVFAYGDFKISSMRGISSYELNGWNTLEKEDFEKSYLRSLFYEPEPTEEGGAAAKK